MLLYPTGFSLCYPNSFSFSVTKVKCQVRYVEAEATDGSSRPWKDVLRLCRNESQGEPKCGQEIVELFLHCLACRSDRRV